MYKPLTVIQTKLAFKPTSFFGWDWQELLKRELCGQQKITRTKAAEENIQNT